MLAAMTWAEVIPLASSADLTSGVASIEPRNFCRSASLRLATTALTCALRGVRQRLDVDYLDALERRRRD